MTKVPHHVGFVPQQSRDEIGDLSIDNRGFCLQLKLFQKGFGKTVVKLPGKS